MTAAGVEWREFVRDALVDRITASLRAGRSVLVDGEAGAGKTTVARQAAPDESAWLEGLEGLAATALAPFSLAALDPPIDSVAAAYRWLRDQAEAGAVLVVDDAQWIDPVSAGLLARAIVHDRIRTIVSVRSGYVMGEDLTKAVADFDRLTVEPLDASMVSFALELALGAEPEADLVRTFAERSAGNPLCLRELVLEAVTTETLRCEPGRGWILTETPTVSVTLAQLIDSRLARMRRSIRHAVELVAVADHLRAELLDDLVDPHSVGEAVTGGWLREKGDELYPGHPTIGDTITNRLSAARRRSLLTELVESTGHATAAKDRLQRLRWQLDLGQVPLLDDLDAGYQAAVRAADLETAGHVASVAHASYPSVTNGLRAANQLHREGEHRRAAQLIESLVPLATTADEAARIASHLTRTQGPLGLFLGTSPDAGALDTSIVRWADAQVEGAPFGLLRVAVDGYLGGDAEAVGRLLEPLLDHSVSICRHDAHEILAWSHFASGDQVGAYEHAVAIEDPDDPYLEDRPQIAPSSYVLGVTARDGGRSADAHEETARAFAKLDDAAKTTVFGVALAHAQTSWACGNITEGLDAIHLAREAGAPTALLAAVTDLNEAICESLGGRRDTPDDTLSGAIDALETAAEFVATLLSGLFTAVLWLHRAAYQTHTEAISEVRSLAAVHRGSAGERYALSVRARLRDVDESMVKRLFELSGTGAYMEATAFLAAAHLDRNPTALCEAADRFESVGTLVEALEAVTAAIEINQADGNAAAARSLLPRHRELLARCPGLRWPLTKVAMDAPDLTRRELQVCELAALGWSNRQIAEELELSVRTVENNLHRAFAKLGINRRTDLATTLGLAAI